MTDVHVVGGGPAGAVAAASAARKGHNVILSEEHECIGMPVHCSGLFSRTGLESI
ncbi:MAG: FAD-dependent oxidoreductase, partial [Thaumarchaeota archaeon]|nr:FAD-dependent oxidoreductase [Nitrososphaerota archaeon]